MRHVLRTLCCLLLAALAARAEGPTFHELLANLSSRRVSAEEALRQTVRRCPADSPKVREAQKRYRTARETTNSFLDLLILDLGQDDLRPESDYLARLNASQEAVDTLIAYLDGADCQGEGQAKLAPLILAAGGKLPDFIAWLGGFLGKRNQEAAAHRASLLVHLKEMRWTSYDRAVEGTEAGAKDVAAEAAAPVLRLETGLHTAVIRALSLSRDGRLALSASEDKTARLWEVSTGRLLHIYRPAVEPGKVGMLYAAALSPDGRLAALGGWTRGAADAGNHVLLVDTQSGAFLKRVDVGPQVVNFLAFSPDGQRLVAHLGGSLGLRVLRVADGAIVAQDPDYPQPSYRGAFDAAGRYAATGDDGSIKLYDATFRLAANVRASAPGPFGIAFSPDGTRIAVAYADSPRVEVRNATDLALAHVPAPGGAKLGLVAWSADGQTLLAAGGEDFGAAANVLRRWSEAGRGPAADTPLAKATVSALIPLAGGDVAYAAQDPAWGVVDAQGRPRRTLALRTADLREAREAFRADARTQRVSLGGAAFSVAELSLVKGPAAPVPPSTALRLDGWKDGEHPAMEGRALTLEPSEVSRSLCVAPDASFLLGTDWYLRAYAARAAERWKVPTPAAVWGLALREDAKVAVALLADGTIRWYRTTDGRELLALFVADDQRWVLWTPSGHFCTSPGGEGLVGWQVNRPGQAADFVPMAHFRDRFWKPELMRPLLDTLDETEALGTLQAAPPPPPAAQAWPPALKILAPADGEPLAGGQVTFKVSVRTYGPAPLRGFRLFLDGARVPPSRGLRPQQSQAAGEGVEHTYAVPVTLPARSVRVGLQAEMENGQLSELMERDLTPAGPPPATSPSAPTLRVLAVGIATYANPKLNLQFPSKDAADICRMLKQQTGRLFGDVQVHMLVNEEATEKNILQAMDQLASTSAPGSVTLYFFSSHGGTNPEKSSYFLVPYDFSLGSWGVTGDAIKGRLEATQGRTLLLMDTCHSGNVLGFDQMRSLADSMKRTRFINELLQSGPGIMVFSSSTGSQTSLESSAWNNGAFTKALCEGLAGGADPTHTGRVTTFALEGFLRQRVPELTGGRQTPVSARTSAATPFPIAVVEN